MTQEKDDVNNDSEQNTAANETDLPDAHGTVSDEDMQAITGENDNRPTGQDHSTDNHERQAPTEGVGAIQDESNTLSDIARIEE